VEFIMMHPLVVSLIAVLVSSLFAFLMGHYVVVPKRCQKQIKSCEKSNADQMAIRDKKKKDLADDIETETDAIHEDIKDLHIRIDGFLDRADKVYVRRDTVLPQLTTIQNELAELRKVIYQLVKVNGG